MTAPAKPSARVAKSRAKRLGAGAVRVELILDLATVATLDRLALAHGGRAKAVAHAVAVAQAKSPDG